MSSVYDLRAFPPPADSPAKFPVTPYASASTFFDAYAEEMSRAAKTIEPEAFDRAAAILLEAYMRGARMFSCGNGGSASIANHVQCDHVKGVRTTTDLTPQVLSLSTNVELLTAHFLQQFHGPDQPPLHLTREALAALAAHNFPGNVRELENALRRAVALSSGGLITIDCLPPEIAASRRKAGAGASPEHRLIADRPTMEELQRRYLQLILEETGWNRRRAAAVLELDRRTIQRLIARYQLQGALDPDGEGELDAEEVSAERPLDIA